MVAAHTPRVAGDQVFDQLSALLATYEVLIYPTGPDGKVILVITDRQCHEFTYIDRIDRAIARAWSGAPADHQRDK